jgi:hypothetical protein
MDDLDDYAERERRRSIIAQARATCERLGREAIEREAFGGPEPTPWRHRVHAEPEPEPPPREQHTDAVEARLASLEQRVAEIEEARMAMLEALGDEVDNLVQAIRAEFDKREDGAQSRWENAHRAIKIEMSALDQRFAELRQLIASEQAKVLDLPANPLRH